MTDILERQSFNSPEEGEKPTRDEVTAELSAAASYLTDKEREEVELAITPDRITDLDAALHERSYQSLVTLGKRATADLAHLPYRFPDEPN